MSDPILSLLLLHDANLVKQYESILDALEWALQADVALPEGMQHLGLQLRIRGLVVKKEGKDDA